jgi:acyl-coenzyme A thioesterase PaaI-like protein
MIFRLMEKASPAWKKRLMKHGFNWFPAYRQAGGRILWVSDDLMCLRVGLTLHRNTRNVHGSLFGGALFSVTDGPHPLLIMMHLGKEYLAWDKSATIRYRRPAFSAVSGDCAITVEDLAIIRQTIAENGQCERTFTVSLKDELGEIHAIIERTVYIASKAHFHSRQQQHEKKNTNENAPT